MISAALVNISTLRSLRRLGRCKFVSYLLTYTELATDNSYMYAAKIKATSLVQGRSQGGGVIALTKQIAKE